MNHRQIILDTETTGLSHAQGHRVIEIGCVELINRRLTGKHFQVYLNPSRAVDEGAFRVHGISTEFLKDKPKFTDILPKFLDYIQDSELIIHNATFDIGFLNAELVRAKAKIQNLDAHHSVIDTLVMARSRHPGQKNNLDALCKRYNVNFEHRTLHGALLDAEILAEVYLAMTGGQVSLSFEAAIIDKPSFIETSIGSIPQNRDNTRVVMADADTLIAHQEYLAFLQKKTKTPSLWEEYEKSPE